MAFYFGVLGGVTGAFYGYFRWRIKRQNVKLVQQNELLEKISAEKETLLRILTHDLVDGIASSHSFIELVTEGHGEKISGELLDGLTMVRQRLEGSLELIDNARELIAIESGKAEIQLYRQNIKPMVMKCVDVIGSTATKKNIVIDVNAPDDDYYTYIEPTFFENSIINNFLSNAIKFSYPGNTIYISLRKNGHVSVEVSNKGSLIPAEKISKLFDPSTKTTTPGTAGEKGTGFGLPLAAKFAEMMDGVIEVESFSLEEEPGNGLTTFTLLLPTAH